MSATPGSLRLDKWLWVARLFKTRTIAAAAVDRGHVQVNGQPAKAGRELRAGDLVRVRRGADVRVVEVLAFAATRGPAPAAQALYEETAESVAARERAAEARRLAAEPALSIEQGRPTKRDRRQLAAWRRWSASVDDPGDPTDSG
jgi:ribosome-associated heat shock protein Hsp15